MSQPRRPQQPPPMSSSRWAAMSAAMLITVLTVSSALGLGPAAALTKTSVERSVAAIAQARHSDPQSTDDGQGTRPTQGLAGDADPSDWLTVDKRQASDHPPTLRGDRGSTSLPDHSGTGKRIVFDESAQRVWLVAAGGAVVRTYLVSGARDEDVLKPGRYRVFSKSREAVSFNSRETMNYMVRFAAGRNAAIGFHDIPAHHDGTLAQSRDELGTPRSAGCVRQWITDARALWEFAPVNTPVIVVA